MTSIIYPLGHSNQEFDRLDKQALIMQDPLLDNLISNAKSCLEIGCGSGSNLPMLRIINPEICYTGIDISLAAINMAQTRFTHTKQANFIVSDILEFESEQKFDLIFVKLVLWSIGSEWKRVLSKVRKLLQPGGIFYALEPYNQLIQFYPPKPAMKAWMKKWDDAAVIQGLNPHIGIEMGSAMLAAGFSHVESQFFPVLAFGKDQEKYLSIINNLQGFYMGAALKQFHLHTQTPEMEKASIELHTFEKTSFVMDALFTAIGC